jgi:N,N'-diacetylchitobiose phosphorylase
LGVRLSFEGLIVDPCIPTDWPGFEVTREWRGATYQIKVENPQGVSKGIASIQLNGESIEGAIPAQAEGSVNHVTVVLG